jgi:hypothetical protein|tara:strand:+ start:152 stop:1048 length:897 start_codon:yes stop_codon:yes gene_type:complete
MSLLNALRERLLGQASMMRPGQGFGGGTQGLLGQGGRFGGGMMQTRMNEPGGLLGGQIPELALLGSALYGQGMQGKDPFEGLFPAYTQAAQVKKALTPEKERLMTAYDPKTGQTVFATRTQIEERGLTPVPEKPEERKIIKDVTGRQRYEDDGSLVFPEVKTPPKELKERKTLQDAEGRYRFVDDQSLVFPNVQTPKKEETLVQKATKLYEESEKVDNFEKWFRDLPGNKKDLWNKYIKGNQDFWMSMLGGVPMPSDSGSGDVVYSQEQEDKISATMDANPGVPRKDIIQALKNAGEI